MLKRSSYPQLPRARYLDMVYELPFQIRSDIKTAMFQYQIIHNILPTEVSLFKAKICDGDICPQCFASRHSLDHMFLHCQLTLSFWDLFQTWWASKSEENVTLTDSMILYEIFDNKEHLYSLNYSLLIAKYSIVAAYKKKSFVLTVFSRF